MPRLRSWGTSVPATLPRARTRQAPAGIQTRSPSRPAGRARARRPRVGTLPRWVEHQDAFGLRAGSKNTVSYGHHRSARWPSAVHRRFVGISMPRPRCGRPRTSPERLLAINAANRAFLRKRGICTTIPVKVDQAAHRTRKGSSGGRPPAFSAEHYKQPQPSSAHQLKSSKSVRWQPDTTKSPSATATSLPSKSAGDHVTAGYVHPRVSVPHGCIYPPTVCDDLAASAGVT